MAYRDNEKADKVGLLHETYHDSDITSPWDANTERRQMPPRWSRSLTSCRSRLIKFFLLTCAFFAAVAIIFFLGRSSAKTNPDGHVKLPWAPKTKGLVISGIKKQNTTWMKDLSADWEVYHYIADDPSAELPYLTLPRNQGNEVMAFLTYIVDNYDNLPDYSVFIHGHNKAWHQEEPSNMLLRAINFDVVERVGWMPLRCTPWGRCDRSEPDLLNPHLGSWGPHVLLRGWHAFTYRPGDSWYEPLPDTLSAACCAQFAASRAQIQRRPRAFWERLRAPLLRDLERDFDGFGVHEDDFNYSRAVGDAFEAAWHWFFGMPAVTCYDEGFCRNEFYQGKIHCNGTTAGWGESHETYKSIECTFDE